MAITRTTVTDDNGTGATGTIADNAWLDDLFDTLDARWSEATITLTGSNNDVAFSQADALRCNNATALTITGLAAPVSPAKPAKRLVIYSVGAGAVTIANNSGSSSAANRILTGTGQNIVLSGTNGVAILVYDAMVTNGAWRVIAFEQGAWVAYTPTVTASAGAFTSVSATGRWRLRGRTVSVQIVITITTNGTAATAILPTLPFTAGQAAILAGKEVAATAVSAPGYIAPAATQVIVQKYDGTYPGANGHIYVLSGEYEI